VKEIGPFLFWYVLLALMGIILLIGRVLQSWPPS
jgi:hypothetical protein